VEGSTTLRVWSCLESTRRDEAGDVLCAWSVAGRQSAASTVATRMETLMG
jgi:hypothetical protein